VSGSGDDVDGDAKVGGDLGETAADVGLRAEVERPPVDEPGSEGLGDEHSAGAVASADRCRLVEQRARIEYLQDLGMRIADRLAPGWLKPARIVDSWPEPGSWIRCSRR